MRYLFILLLNILYVSVLAQSKEFITLDNKIQQLVQNSQWDEVLLVATDLISEDFKRGEGYYYTSLAFLKLQDVSKASEYLVQAEKFADVALKSKIEGLKAQINRQAIIKSETSKIISGGNKQSAGDYRKLWELDKSNLEIALMAVDKYIEKEEFVEALQILNDPSVNKESDAKKLIAMINQKPKMVRLSRFNAVMNDAELYFENKEFEKAIAKFTEAIGLFPNDKNASLGLRESKDELAWSKAVKDHTIKSYMDYVNNNPYGKYTEEVKRELPLAILRNARNAAKVNNFDMAKNDYKDYQSYFPMGPQISIVNKELCELYIQQGQKYETKKTVNEINKSIELYKLALACSSDTRLAGKVKSLHAKSRRWSRTDLGYFGWAADPVNLYGVSFGGIKNRKFGVYFTFRTGSNIEEETADWETDNGNSLQESFDKDKIFTGLILDQQIFGTIGVTKKIFHPIWIYAGGGLAYLRELREFQDRGGSNEYVVNKDRKVISPNVEAGLKLKVGFLVFSYGINKPISNYFKKPVIYNFGAAFSLNGN
jgi:tetratricopeptide (TPR) repeat protein